jgi:hypothetical protein
VAYGEQLADRVRELIAARSDLSERTPGGRLFALGG